jgi:predicted esterase
VFLVAVVTATTAIAQTSRAKKEKPKLRTVSLTTKDGVKLRAFYFPSDKEKNAIPVLLIHEWGGQASPYGKLVVELNKAGCAVLVPDFRGHGGSNTYTDVRGNSKEFNPAQMSKRDVENILAFDLEEAKSFLKDENNEGKLNLNALVVIGVREGCVLASHWTQRDHQWPSIGQIKQGQDVRALIFVSPDKQVKGVAMDPTLTDRNLLSLPIMIIAGDDSTDASEAERIAKRIESKKRAMGRGEVSGFELVMPKTTLSGAALVNESSVVIPKITEFITTNVKSGDDGYPWIDRK